MISLIFVLISLTMFTGSVYISYVVFIVDSMIFVCY